MKYDLVIFDCDGTLVDTELLYNTVISEILTEQGLGEYTPDVCLDQFTGLTLANIRKKIEQKHNRDLSKTLTSDLYVGRAQAEMDKGVSSIEYADEILQFCKSANIPICIGSNGERSSVIKSLKLSGLYDYFGNDDVIFTKIQVAEPKPAPDLFLYAAEQMNVAADKCLVMEDSAAGVTAGVAANMDVFGYTGSHHAPDMHAQTLKNVGAAETFSSLIHTVNHLKKQK